uniref:Uncharacterized protein n=1 Tax=viral metagenome TaxID=1070528 RepID=A0A6M3JG73_9ZZZZ
MDVGNPEITELEVEYNTELRGGEYDGLKFHFMKEPPFEWVLRDIKIQKPLRHTEYCYRLTGIFVQRRPEPDEEPCYVEWDSGFLDDSLPCTHIHNLLPIPVEELREVYPEILVWNGNEGRGVVIVHAFYDLYIPAEF